MQVGKRFFPLDDLKGEKEIKAWDKDLGSMGTQAEDRDLEKGSRNRYIVLLLVLTGVLMAVVDGSVVSIALPTITKYFDVSIAQSQMIMTSYLVTLTSLLMIFGKVAEYVGKAKLFWLGVAFFSFSSLACGISTSLELLVICRIIQATGAAMMFSISSAIIFQAFPRGEQGRAMGYIGATVAIGSILGPTLGGIIVDLLGWTYISDKCAYRGHSVASFFQVHEN